MGLRVIKWAYDMGAKNERERIEREMFLKLGNRPEEPVDDLPSRASLDRYYLARSRWYAIQSFLNGYWDRHADFDPEQVERLISEKLL